MPRLIFTVSEEERELWVERAHNERVSLSEWLRRAANERAQNGGARLAGVGIVRGLAAGEDESAGESGRGGGAGALAGGGSGGVRPTGAATSPAASSHVIGPEVKQAHEGEPTATNPFRDRLAPAVGEPRATDVIPAEPGPDEMTASSGLPPAASVPAKKARARSAPRTAMCEHRVPAGSYCRKCDQAQ